VSRRFPIFALLCALFSLTVPLAVKASPAEQKELTAEQVVETTIAVYGTRPGLAQVRRNGDERGKLTRTGSDGRTEDVSYERRFIRGESTLKDKIRLDQKTPTIEYALIAGEGKTWGVINGAVFTPRSDPSADFLAEVHHGIDALLRYKENESTITLVGKDKQKNVDVYMIDLTDKDQRKTRYYISAKYFRILWLEYEDPAPIGGAATKYTRKFFDYRTAQGTLVPFRTVLLENGKPTEESRVLTITFGVKLDESLFRDPDAQASATNP
jgi:hypothetical protein